MLNKISRNPLAVAVILALLQIPFLLMIPENGIVLYDESYFWVRSILVQSGDWFPWHGVFISGSSGAFTPGGFFYIFMSLPFFFTHSPIAGSVFFILVQALALYLLYTQAKKSQLATPLLAFLWIILSSSSITRAHFSDRVWNPHAFFVWGPLFFAYTLYLYKQARLNKLAIFFFGVMSAALAQIHLSGFLAISVALIWLSREKHFTMQEFLRFCFCAFWGALLLYLPYFIRDYQLDFQNTISLSSSNRSLVGRVVNRALVAPIYYSSPIKNWEEMQAFFRHPMTLIFSVYQVFILYRYFKMPSTPLTRLVKWAWLFFAPFLLVIGRTHHDHYVTCIIVLLQLPTPIVLAHIYKNPDFSRFYKRLMYGVFVLMLLGHFYKIYDEYIVTNSEQHWTAQNRIQFVANKYSQSPNAPLVIADYPGGAWDYFSTWALRKYYFNQDFKVIYQGKECEIRLPGRDENVKIEKWIHPDSGFVCSNE